MILSGNVFSVSKQLPMSKRSFNPLLIEINVPLFYARYPHAILLGTYIVMSISAKKRLENRHKAIKGIANTNKPRCACCGERRIWALTFDHKNNDGAKHRKEQKSNDDLTIIRRYYSKYKTYPIHIYNINCYNCNMAKHIYKTCPHSKEVIMNPQLIEILKSYTKVFLATVLSLFLADGGDVFAVDFNDVRTWLSAGAASILPLIITALDPSDERFGKGA